MELPKGFQPRPCVFCSSRALHNRREQEGPWEGLFRVMCLFCKSLGPCGSTTDEAWLSWSGEGAQASPMFGSPLEMTL